MSEIIQGSDEWKQLRLGLVTASRISDVMARTKSGYSASRDNYMAELITERLTGVPYDQFVSKDMQWGIDHEDEAAAAYAFRTGSKVVKVGFVRHSEYEAGASPDRFVDDDGLAEFKCPKTAKHIKALLGAEIDDDYLKQMDWQMECTGRKWVDFVSYDPRLPEHLRLKIKRVHRNESRLSIMRVEVLKFIIEMKSTLERLSILKS